MGNCLGTWRLTVCVTCVWAGVDSAWEQEKLEARNLLENAAESHMSGARFVRRFLTTRTLAFYFRRAQSLTFRFCNSQVHVTVLYLRLTN
jgi:hypothetical protein